MAGYGLQLDEHLAFQRRACLAQRLGWAALALCVIAGALGVLGGKGLGSTRAGSTDASLRVEAPRWARARAPMDVKIWIAPGADAHETWVELDSHYLEAMSLRQVQPPPQHTRSTPRGLRLGFARHANTPLAIRLEFEPRRAGAVDLQLWSEGGARVRVRHWIHP